MLITSYLTLFTSLLLILLGILVLSKNRKSEINLSFSLICLSSFIWLFCYSQAYRTSDPEIALFWFKIGYLGVIFIAITYYHFSTTFLNLRKVRFVVFLNYALGLFFALLFINTSLFINNVHHFGW